MQQEKFVNIYIELLNNTLTESLQKSLVLQAQKKLVDTSIEELTKKITENEFVFSETIKKKDVEIGTLRHQLEEMRKMKDISVAEAQESKKNAVHYETFKNELTKERKVNEQLKADLIEKQNTIEQLTTEIAKLLKPEVEAKVKVGKKKLILTNQENLEVKTIEDAGSF